MTSTSEDTSTLKFDQIIPKLQTNGNKPQRK